MCSQEGDFVDEYLLCGHNDICYIKRLFMKRTVNTRRKIFVGNTTEVLFVKKRETFILP